MELAATLLGEADSTVLATQAQDYATRVVRLSAPVPVYVLYMTAYADAAGEVRYADDIYRRDPPVLRALGRGPHPHAPAGAPGQIVSECAQARPPA